MPKPTVFLSHSTTDNKFITELKRLLVNKSGNSIDFFSSSDGQSISFGKNWVHSVEEALVNSSILFVFLTPNSIFSNWIYFESGFSYSKGIEVIPIGVFGIDLNDINPPLNLLQGFNLNSYGALNNIINILNKKFDFTHNESFTDADFKSLQSLNHDDNWINSSLAIINNIHINLTNGIKIPKADEVTIRKAEFEMLIKYFEDNNLDIYKDTRVINCKGLKILQTSHGYMGDNSIIYELKIDGNVYKSCFTHLKNLISILYGESLSSLTLLIYIKQNYDVITETFKLSSRLTSYDVTFSSIEDAFRFKNYDFKIQSSQNQSYIRIFIDVNYLEHLEIPILLDILIESGIIYS